MAYDTARAGGLGPLRLQAKGHKRVMARVIPTETGALESIDDLRRQFDAPAQFCDLDQLGIRSDPAGELGAGPAAQYIRVLQGGPDIAWGLQGYSFSQLPLSLHSAYPAARPMAKVARILCSGDAAGLLAKDHPASGVLALSTADLAVQITRSKPVRAAEDPAGLKLRVSGSVSG